MRLAAEFLKSEETLWANFAAKTLRNTGPAIEEDLPEEEEEIEKEDAMARHPLNRAALVSLQDLGLILPQAYDQGLFRFQEPRSQINHNVLSKAMNDHPKALMDIIDAEVDCEPSMSAPNDFRPNRAMKRSTRTSKVVRRTGVFNSTTFRDKVMEEKLRLTTSKAIPLDVQKLGCPDISHGALRCSASGMMVFDWKYGDHKDLCFVASWE
ncbi:unnamed protein product [Effrenium voratum]|nr:unnamed protein product [Effrenium voratum]